MSNLRPELAPGGTRSVLPDSLVLEKLYQAVAKRRGLIRGQLHDGGKHCAMGAFWEDNPGKVVRNSLIDEVAAVNDSVPPTATPRERWEHVMRWLRWRTNRVDR